MNMHEQLIAGYTLYMQTNFKPHQFNFVHSIMMMTLILCAFRYKQYRCKFLHRSSIHLYQFVCVC